MSSLVRRIQGHYHAIDADRSTMLQFKQFIGDFDTAGNVFYCFSSLAALVTTAFVAVEWALPNAATIALVLLVGVGAIALRIHIFNRYAFSVQHVRVSPQGDLEWPGGWLSHDEIVSVHARRASRPARGFEIACSTHSGELRRIGLGLTQAKAEAICRDISVALNVSTRKPITRTFEPSLPLEALVAQCRG